MAILRVETNWTGGPSSPGQTVMFVRDAGIDPVAAHAAVRNFWEALDQQIPAAYSLQVSNVSDMIDETTGTLIGESVAGTAQAATNGDGLGVWAAGAGCRIDWLTGAIVNGRRLTGRTYLVPIMSAVYATDGTLDPNWVIELQNAAAGLISALDTAGMPLVVWHRPSTAGAGVAHDVAAARIPDKSAFLRGRRD